MENKVLNFLGLISLLVLNSCSKEATLDEVSPASLEATLVLKTWATKNDKLNQANLIKWEYSIPITLPDSSKGYSAPVKTNSGFKEYITFELGGKRQGWYKSYKRLNDTDMEIIIQSIEGKTVQAGILHKAKNIPPKGKLTPIRVMNDETGEIARAYWLEWFTVTAPRLYPPDAFLYVGTYQFEFKAFYDSDNQIGGSGTGSSNLYFEDFNTTRIIDNLTDPCFKAVLNDLINKNMNNVVRDLVSEFVNDPNSKIIFKQKFEVTKNGVQLNASFDPNTNEITLSESKLKNASIEFIAITIIHELFHAKIGNPEQFDHTKMLNEYVIPAGAYMKELYNLNSTTAENLFSDGLRGATGHTIFNFTNQRYLQIDEDMQNYYFTKKSGNHCN